jgi:hypothetical protein
MKNESYPRESLRHKLTGLGIPREAHDLQALSGMLPIRLNGSPLNRLDADSLAETLIYLVGKEIMRVPCRLHVLLAPDWGTHVCQLYRSEEDLLEFRVSYFKQGLENDEYCVWVAAPPLTAQAGREALARAVPRFEDYERGIEFVDYDGWYRDEDGQLKATGALLENWVRKTQEALNLGYLGLRCSGDACGIEKKDWNGFVKYECELNAAIDGLRMKVACAYPLSGCGPRQMTDVLDSHQDVCVKRGEWWHRIATADANEAKAVLMALQGGKS